MINGFHYSGIDTAVPVVYHSCKRFNVRFSPDGFLILMIWANLNLSFAHNKKNRL
jgi:hypothetical protein